MERYLEIAAIVCAVAIFALLIVAVVRSGMPRSAQIFRFRRSLKRLDDVASRWAMELEPRPPRRSGEMVHDPRRHRRPGRDDS